MADASDDLEEAPARRAIERNFRAVDEARASRGRARRDGPPGGAGLAAGPAGRDGADHRPAHPEHLQDLLPAAGLRLSDEQVARLGRHTAPLESYPQRMLAEQVGIDVSQQPLGRR